MYVHVCMYVCMYACTYVCMYVCMYVAQGNSTHALVIELAPVISIHNVRMYATRGNSCDWVFVYWSTVILRMPCPYRKCLVCVCTQARSTHTHTHIHMHGMARYTCTYICMTHLLGYIIKEWFEGFDVWQTITRGNWRVFYCDWINFVIIIIGTNCDRFYCHYAIERENSLWSSASHTLRGMKFSQDV